MLDKKIHQIWLKGESGEYEPWGYYTYKDEDYQHALKIASHMTTKGYDIKLVTLTVTTVL